MLIAVNYVMALNIWWQHTEREKIENRTKNAPSWNLNKVVNYRVNKVAITLMFD